jgi:hypothetical protein
MESIPVEQKTDNQTLMIVPSTPVAAVVKKSILPWSLVIMGSTALVFPLLTSPNYR